MKVLNKKTFTFLILLLALSPITLYAYPQTYSALVVKIIGLIKVIIGIIMAFFYVSLVWLIIKPIIDKGFGEVKSFKESALAVGAIVLASLGFFGVWSLVIILIDAFF